MFVGNVGIFWFLNHHVDKVVYINVHKIIIDFVKEAEFDLFFNASLASPSKRFWFILGGNVGTFLFHTFSFYTKQIYQQYKKIRKLTTQCINKYKVCYNIQFPSPYSYQHIIMTRISVLQEWNSLIYYHCFRI